MTAPERRRRSTDLRLTFLTRAYCHLCDTMRDALVPLAAAHGATVREIDVDADPALEAAYGDLVPVVLYGDVDDGQVLCHYHLDRARIVAALSLRLEAGGPGADRASRPISFLPWTKRAFSDIIQHFPMSSLRGRPVSAVASSRAPSGAFVFRLQSPRALNPQFFDHRPHRPRQVDARRPLHPALRRTFRPRDERAGLGLDGPGARARHHDQGADRRADLQGPRRRDVQPQPDRHAGTRRLRVRGLAFAGGLRGRVAGRRRVAGRGSADGGQLLHGRGAGRHRRARAEQDRPAVGGSRARDRRDRGHHRHRRDRCGARERQERRRHRRHPRGGDRQDPAARMGIPMRR